ncbi:MAG: sulfite reductase flavoprotein subunit alpha [Akkermansiaceae bacterium]
MPEVLTEKLIPEDAPFSQPQREWLNGYLSGLLEQFTSSASSDVDLLPVTIIWGSQTGTAEGLAKKFAKLGKNSGLDSTLIDGAEYALGNLPSESHLLIITSTYGDGEPPDNMLAFCEALNADSAPKLEGVNYSVLSIGDSSYPDFCQCGIDIDTRLAELGAKAITPRVDCDLELDEDFAQWTNSVISSLGQAAPADVVDEDEGYNKKNPFVSKTLRNENLNDEDSEKATHHIELCLKDSGLSYEAGDAVGIYPVNDSGLVDAFLALLPFDGTERVEGDISLRETLSSNYEIRNLSIPLLKTWAQKTQNKELIALSQDKAEASSFMWGRDIIDLQREYPLSFDTPDDFLAPLKKLAPRLYSISSSPKAHSDEVHVTVGFVKYQSKGELRKGVCSSYLAEKSEEIAPRVFIHSNKAFRPPEDPATPMIMVGPGTGIAPFRAFLEERRATQASGKNWLFFGNPHIATDYLYQDELEGFQKEGWLQQLSTAFSRDQENKIYVQDLMRKHGEHLFAWLEEGASFYVCGDASRMAKDVDLALHDVIEKHGKLSTAEASEYVANLKKLKRYSRDVY